MNSTLTKMNQFYFIGMNVVLLGFNLPFRSMVYCKNENEFFPFKVNEIKCPTSEGIIIYIEPNQTLFELGKFVQIFVEIFGTACIELIFTTILNGERALGSNPTYHRLRLVVQ